MVNISAKYKHVHIWLKALLFQVQPGWMDVVSLAKVINTSGSMCAQGSELYTFCHQTDNTQRLQNMNECMNRTTTCPCRPQPGLPPSG